MIFIKNSVQPTFDELITAIYGSNIIWSHDYQGYSAGATVQNIPAADHDSVPTGSPPAAASGGPNNLNVPQLDGSTDYFTVEDSNPPHPTISNTIPLTVGILCRPEGSAATWLMSKRGPNSTTDYEWAVFLTGFASGAFKLATVVYSSAGAAINAETSDATVVTQNAYSLLIVSFPAIPDFNPRHTLFCNSGTPVLCTQTKTTDTAASARSGTPMIGTEADNLSLKFQGKIIRTFAAAQETSDVQAGLLTGNLRSAGWYT